MFDFSDYRWLAGDEARPHLNELSQERGSLLQAAGRLRRQFSASRTHLLLELVDLRRRGQEKFLAAHEMFFTRKGLEQATDQWVAEYKAQRFSPFPWVADLACGVGGDLRAIAGRTGVVGIDRDPVTTYLAAANLERLGRPAGRASAVCLADVGQLPLDRLAAWHLDPDRRSGKKRTSQIAFSEPSSETIDALLRRSPHAAIKLAPAAEIPPSWRDQSEYEWIGRDGQCRQLVLWFGDLASQPATRRATLLGSDAAGELSVLRQVAGDPVVVPPRATQVHRYLYDPDATVLAAGLLGPLADEHHLSRLSTQSAYLTGDRRVTDPALSAFEVLEVLPLDLRRLRQAVQTRGLGLLEVKKRGVEHDPDQLRRYLATKGSERGVVVLTPHGGRQIAVVARRLSEPS